MRNLSRFGFAQARRPLVNNASQLGITALGWALSEDVAIYENVSIAALDGTALDLNQLKGKATLVVKVASRCGLTPEYAGLEERQEPVRALGVHGARTSRPAGCRARSSRGEVSRRLEEPGPVRGGRRHAESDEEQKNVNRVTQLPNCLLGRPDPSGNHE
jgi:hypothetical protein